MEDVELESVEKHEMWHMKQAYEFCKRHGYVIKRENYDEYLHLLSADCKHLLSADCKKRIEEKGINAYNVGNISVYARREFYAGRYDEVEAEFMVLGMKKG